MTDKAPSLRLKELNASMCLVIGKKLEDIMCYFFMHFVFIFGTPVCVCDCCVSSEGTHVCGYMHISTPKQTSHGSFLLQIGPLIGQRDVMSLCGSTLMGMWVPGAARQDNGALYTPRC